MAFWRRLLAGSDWSHLSSVLTPSFFDVVSARDLSIRAAELARNWFEREGYLACVGRLRNALTDQDIGLAVVNAPATRSIIPFRTEPWPKSGCPMAQDGTTLLRLFFLQIATAEAVFLDLRANRFCRCPNTQRIMFHPLPLWVAWRSDFVEGIRNLYRGFYLGESAVFEQATRALGVSAANDVFERAFGGERKCASSYSLAQFRDTFQQVFVKCRDAKTAFHPDFVTLGIMLATLYDHLETIGGQYDVQAAYLSVNRQRAASAGRGHDLARAAFGVG